MTTSHKSRAPNFHSMRIILDFNTRDVTLDRFPSSANTFPSRAHFPGHSDHTSSTRSTNRWYNQLGHSHRNSNRPASRSALACQNHRTSCKYVAHCSFWASPLWWTDRENHVLKPCRQPCFVRNERRTWFTIAYVKQFSIILFKKNANKPKPGIYS